MPRRTRAPAPGAGPTSATLPLHRGHVAEAAFLHRAMQLGFVVCKPYGDSEPFDFVVVHGRKLSRVQVKSTAAAEARGYQLSAAHRWEHVAYSRREIDFIAAYIARRRIWYIIPVNALGGVTNFRLVPGSRRPLEKFRNARRLLR